jgi:SAM-dependent methyltransferase
MKNADPATVAGFGEEWAAFDQSELTSEQTQRIFEEYFQQFPWAKLPVHAVGFDLGCGSGRWAALVASRVAAIHCIDASAQALEVAKKKLASHPNAVFHHASVDAIPLPDASADFGYSLGVLHHVPDTLAAIRSCAAKLKPGAPFLLYLYYRFDDRPVWFRGLWRVSDLLRRAISRLPFRARLAASQLIAVLAYWPLARLARIGCRLGMRTAHWPLDYYRDKQFYVMRTDALDRFGTQLEQRFTRPEIQQMLVSAGFVNVRFNSTPPFWCAVAEKAMTDER